MTRPRRNSKATVRGIDLPGPRMTRWAWAYLALYVALPVMALAMSADLVAYLIADRVFGVCYALLCLF
jgi:hypothetical protein